MQIEKLTQCISFNKTTHFLTLDTLRGVAAFSIMDYRQQRDWMSNKLVAVVVLHLYAA